MDLIAVAGKAGIVRRTNLDSLKAHAERVHLPWHVARTVAVMAEVPILKVNRMMFLDAAGAEAFDRAVARFRHLDAALSCIATDGS